MRIRAELWVDCVLILALLSECLLELPEEDSAFLESPWPSLDDFASSASWSDSPPWSSASLSSRTLGVTTSRSDADELEGESASSPDLGGVGFDNALVDSEEGVTVGVAASDVITGEAVG
jgi:hypothetical protein